jgi:hypothetical protein
VAARAATDLADAYAGAAGGLQRFVVLTGAGTATMRALTRLEECHVRLGEALRARDEAGFKRTARAIGDQETMLEHELARWQASLNGATPRG